MRPFAIIAAGLAAVLPVSGAAEAPDGFVDAAKIAPGVVYDIRYAGADNFVGAPVDGYGAPRCLLTREAAAGLAAAQAELESMNLRLRVYDCYRPQRAVNHFVRWAADERDIATKPQYYPDVPKAELFALGYIAERSGHSRGSAVDLTIDGLDMGSSWDRFGEISHAASGAVGAEARANRLLLKLVMEKHGFENYDREWWHYTLSAEPFPETYFDFPIEPPDTP